MKTQNGESMTENQAWINKDAVAEVERRLTVGDYLVAGGQRMRIAAIYYLTTHNCITVEMVDGSKAGWGRIKPMLDAGSMTLVKCSQPSTDCGECSLGNYGQDCESDRL